jgi:hypothetical protein
MKTLLNLVVIALVPWSAPAAELKLVHRFGQPIEFGKPVVAGKAAWSGHLGRTSWIDDEHVVIASHPGKLACSSIKTAKSNGHSKM